MLNVLKKAARAGGEELKKRFGTVLTKTAKTRESDFATEADHASEAVILNIIKAELPHVSVYSEETGLIHNASPYTIYVDPLDGTHNFFHGIPTFTVSIALTHEGKTIAGVVYHPLFDALYVGELGKGSYRNTLRLHVNDIPQLSRATVALCCAVDTPRNIIVGITEALFADDGVERYLWQWSPAYDLCLLAQGKVAGFIAYEVTTPYDLPAGKLIAEEAGARVTRFGSFGEDFMGTFVISNPYVHEALVEKVRHLMHT